MNENEITKHLKLPFQFDKERLVQDLELILNSNWISHFNTSGYEGKWTSAALYSPAGNENDIFAVSPSNKTIQETKLIQNCNYFKEVIRHFECPLLTVRLLKLGPGAIIKPHIDYNLGYENDCFRIHIPITTNPKVEFFLNGSILIMQQGECWYTNVNYTHSVANFGTTDRVHLVIDGQRNEWSDELFFSLVPKESLIFNKKQNLEGENLNRTIEELRLLQPPNFENLIRNLMKK